MIGLIVNSQDLTSYGFQQANPNPQSLTLFSTSSFNHFGPHHYYNGDWPVVSPGQVLGEKNFADAPDAPAHTHVPEWHFKPLRLPGSLLAFA